LEFEDYYLATGMLPLAIPFLDPKHQAEPIVASFDLSVGDPSLLAYRNLILYVVIPVSLLVFVVCLVALYRRRKQRKVNYDDDDG
jgi:hypothetical protein